MGTTRRKGTMTQEDARKKIVVIGGGAAGIFAAITAKATHPNASVIVYEKTNTLLSKVRVSGGGRCNVTHACFSPKELTTKYPRGEKELLGPFHRFMTSDTIQWFEERGVTLKTEADGRMFPVTDSSQTIIDCLLHEAKKLGVEIHLQARVDNKTLHADRIILATGSNKKGHEIATHFGHTIQKPVPSLFTLNIKDFPLGSIAGVSVEAATIRLKGTKVIQEGPLLITHWGFSGPCALKVSAFGARILAEHNYEMGIEIDWLPNHSEEALIALLRQESPAKMLANARTVPLPKRLWQLLIPFDKPLRMLRHQELQSLVKKLKCDTYEIKGKTTNKEEFVTCGGVTLSEVNFKTMESKVRPGLFFCGEILDIDGITGGFNFQNAWTTGFIAGSAPFPS